MAKRMIWLTKSEAQSMLGAIDWCECDFKLGKRKESVREKILKAFPDLREDESSNS